MTALAWLAIAAALAALTGSLPHLTHGLHALGLYALIGVAVLVWWRHRRHRAAAYHRHGVAGLTHHRRPPLARRARLTCARLRHLHLTTAARTA